MLSLTFSRINLNKIKSARFCVNKGSRAEGPAPAHQRWAGALSKWAIITDKSLTDATRYWIVPPPFRRGGIRAPTPPNDALINSKNVGRDPFDAK
jgi:hypothetical protein